MCCDAWLWAATAAIDISSSADFKSVKVWAAAACTSRSCFFFNKLSPAGGTTAGIGAVTLDSSFFGVLK